MPEGSPVSNPRLHQECAPWRGFPLVAAVSDLRDGRSSARGGEEDVCRGEFFLSRVTQERQVDRRNQGNIGAGQALDTGCALHADGTIAGSAEVLGLVVQEKQARRRQQDDGDTSEKVRLLQETPHGSSDTPSQGLCKVPPRGPLTRPPRSRIV